MRYLSFIPYGVQLAVSVAALSAIGCVTGERLDAGGVGTIEVRR